MDHSNFLCKLAHILNETRFRTYTTKSPHHERYKIDQQPQCITSLSHCISLSILIAMVYAMFSFLQKARLLQGAYWTEKTYGMVLCVELVIVFLTSLQIIIFWFLYEQMTSVIWWIRSNQYEHWLDQIIERKKRTEWNNRQLNFDD